jgi:hypothetical protein
VSIIVGQPFTLQYARRGTPQEMWSTPDFIWVNYAITAVWAVAFAVMVAADLAIIYVPGLPISLGIGATAVAIIGAAYFTQWYPERKRRNF